jgi:acyl carrier protein
VNAAESERLDPQAAAVTGLGRALRCRHVDVDLPPAGSWQRTRLARALAAELSARAPETLVAYRGGERWAETYEPLPASPAAAPSSWLAPGAICALTGAAEPLADRLAAALGAQVERDDPAAVRQRHGRLDLVLHWVGPDAVAADLAALEDALRAEPPAACLILSATADALGDAGDLSAASAAAAADAFVRAHNQREPAPWMRVSLEAWGDGSPLALPDETAAAALARLLALDPAAHAVVSSVPPRSRRAALEKQTEKQAETGAYERPDLETPYAAPQGETERRLAGLWRDLLGVEQVGRDDDFFELGGHSLLATRLISRIREAFGRELRLESVFEAPTLARLARRIEEDPAEAAAAIVRAPRPPEVPELPLSYAQQRLLFLDVLSPGDVSYNLGLGLRLQGDLRPAALRWALDRLVERHEVLRTTFVLAQGRASQVIAPVAPLEMPVLDLAALPAETAEAEIRRLSVAEAHRPIDLFRGPVLRARLLRRAADEHALLLTIHHIAADGWSFGILYRELAELYEAAAEGRPPRLPELPVQYADFAWWQRSAAQQEELERQLDYWRERLAGFTPAELPGDRPRPPARSGRGAAHPVAFPPVLADALRRLSREHEATMFMTLVSAFLAVLHYYLRGHDLTIGTDVANRTRGEAEGLIGLFVNQLVLRNDLAGDPTFVEVLERVRGGTLEAYAHQDAPFDRLVEILNPVRDMSRTPLFQIKLVLQNTPMESRALPGLTISPLGFEQRTAKFDLLLNLSEGPAGITGVVEYSTDLYDAATVARLTDRFERVLARVAERPDVRLGEVAAELAERDREEERQRLQEHRQARTRTVERVRRKAIPVTG